MTLKPFLVPALALLSLPALFGCGSDERITGVFPLGEVDAAPDEDDDINLPGGNDDLGDDDTGTVPTSRPDNMPPAPAPNLTSNIGQECERNADCGAGLECITADSNRFFDGGPAHGMCSMPCSSDFDCLAVDSNGFCLPINDTELMCVPACVPGDSLLGETKCVGRQDLACAAVSGYAFCVPMCSTDADCPDGRVCDIGFGTCVDGPLRGDPIGAACDPTEDMNTSCASGLCLGFTEEFGACSGLCRTGTIGCGSGNAMPDDPSEPICLALGNVGLNGDIGQCIQRCNCDLDCTHPDAKCFAPFDDDDDALQAFGTIGICINGDAADDPDAADLRIGIECTDGREPPRMSEAGVADGGMSSADSGPNQTPVDSGSGEVEAPVEAGPAPMPTRAPDAAPAPADAG